MLGATRFFDARDQLFDVLHAIFGGDQDGIFGFDDDVTFETERRDEPTLGEYETVARLGRDHIDCRIIGYV